jgi:hypothetical protein
LKVILLLTYICLGLLTGVGKSAGKEQRNQSEKSEGES